MFPSLARRNPIVGMVDLFRLFVWLLVNLMMREQTLIPGFTARFCKIDTREDANIHKAISCKYPSNNICTVVGEWHHGYLLLFFDTLRPRVIDDSEGVAAFGVGFCA